MTDFFADLESELAGAARRRSAGERSRPRAGRPAVAAGAAVMAALAVAMLVLLTPGSGVQDRGSVPPPANGATTVVAVLNGTTTPGLAARASERLMAAGFAKSGKVDTWRSQTVRSSLVLHAPGSAAAAREVAARLGIVRFRRGTAAELSLGGAPVVVVLGRDQALRPELGRTVETVAGRIAFLNATANDNRIASRVADRLKGQIRFDETVVRVAPFRDERFSRVLYDGKGRRLAERVARVLGIATVAPAQGDRLAATASGDAGGPVVVLGADKHEGGEEWIVGAEARILVLDGSARPRLGRGVRDRLRGVNYERVRLGAELTGSPLPESAVAYGSGAQGVARRIASYLGIERVEPAPMSAGTDVAVTVGDDLRRTR